MSVSRRRLVFEGRHVFSAVVVPDSASARASILTSWTRGTVVQRTALGLLVRFPVARELDAETMSGWGLVERKGVFVGGPLTDAGLEALGAPPGSVVVPFAGGWRAVVPEPQEVDPSQWLELPALVVHQPPPRAASAALVRTQSIAPRPIELKPDPRTLSPEVSQVVAEALQGAVPNAPRPPFFRRLATRFLRWWRARRDRARALPEATPAGPSVWARLEQWLNTQVDRTPLGRWLDELNRTYVDRLLKMFEQEALDDALKHAVPLSRKTAAPDAQPARMPFGARRSLDVNFGARPVTGGASTVMPAGVYETLKQRYRAAAEKLEKAGRVDEAAFVLADLLDAPQEAVDLFERHHQFEKAARLAEARNLAPDLCVRLWVLAKDVPRAVALARRHRVFAAAVARLEKGALGEARVLRLEWANWLASAGDLAGAVAAAGPIPEARALVLRWVELGIEAGGPQRAPLLVKRIELEPATAAPHVQAALELLADGAEATADERAALGEALAHSSAPAVAQVRAPLVRRAIRSLVRDEASLGVSRPGVLGKLLVLDDGPLRVDVPNFAPGVRALRKTPARLERVSTALTPHDAVLLPSGQLMVALGEAGVALVAHDGRVTWRAEVPAYSLVASDEGNLVLALAPREDLTTVSKLTLAPRRAERWAELPLTCASPTLREGIWFVGMERGVTGLDVLGEQPLRLWELATPPGTVVHALATDANRVHALVRGDELTRLAWSLPSFQLEQQAALLGAEQVTRQAIAADGAYVLVGTEPLRAWTPPAPASQVPQQQHLPGVLAGTPACVGASFAVPVRWRHEAPDQLDVIVRPGQWSIGFGHAQRASARFHRGHLLVCCDNGRVVCLELAQQRLVRDVVVTS